MSCSKQALALSPVWTTGWYTMPVMDALSWQLNGLLIQDGDFASLCAACASLNTLDEGEASMEL